MNRNNDDFNAITNPNSVHNTQRFRQNIYLSPIDDYSKCNLARIPPSIVTTSSVTPEELRFEVLQLVTELSNTFTNVVPQSFSLFGIYRNETNLIFSDNTKNIVSFPPETTYAEALGQFLPFLENNDQIYCVNFAQHITLNINKYLLIICILLMRNVNLFVQM